MSWQGPSKRTLREEDSYTESAALLEPDAKRFDELVSGITWRIASDAEGCPLIDGGPFRVAKAHASPGGPIIGVYFTINSDNVCSLWYVAMFDEDPWLEEEDSTGEDAI